MINALPTLILSLLAFTLATAFPVAEPKTVRSTTVAHVNIYADPQSNCKGKRTPVKLTQNSCYGPVDTEGFEIGSIVGSVGGNECSGMFFSSSL
jgi:hypothetical protein